MLFSQLVASSSFPQLFYPKRLRQVALVIERRTRDQKVAGWGAIKSTRLTEPSIPSG